MIHDLLDHAVVKLLPTLFTDEETGQPAPSTRAELEDVLIHTVVERLHEFLRRGLLNGVVTRAGSVGNLLILADPSRLIELLDAPTEDNVVHVANWGYRKPHLMAGDQYATVHQLPVRRPQEQPTLPDAG